MLQGEARVAMQSAGEVPILRDFIFKEIEWYALDLHGSENM